MQRDQVACPDVRAAWPEVGKESSGLWLPGQRPFTFLLQLMPCKFILYQLGVVHQGSSVCLWFWRRPVIMEETSLWSHASAWQIVFWVSARCMVDAAWNKADPSPALMESTVWGDTHGQEAVKQTRRRMCCKGSHRGDCPTAATIYMWPWVSFVTSISLSFLISKMTHSEVVTRTQWNDAYKAQCLLWAHGN